MGFAALDGFLHVQKIAGRVGHDDKITLSELGMDSCVEGFHRMAATHNRNLRTYIHTYTLVRRVRDSLGHHIYKGLMVP